MRKELLKGISVHQILAAMKQLQELEMQEDSFPAAIDVHSSAFRSVQYEGEWYELPVAYVLVHGKKAPGPFVTECHKKAEELVLALEAGGYFVVVLSCYSAYSPSEVVRSRAIFDSQYPLGFDVAKGEVYVEERQPAA